jgi:hypothetical protein
MIKALHPPPADPTPKTEMVKGLERAFRRMDKNLRAEHRQLGLPLVVWKNGRVCKIKP